MRLCTILSILASTSLSDFLHANNNQLLNTLLLRFNYSCHFNSFPPSASHSHIIERQRKTEGINETSLGRKKLKHSSYFRWWKDKSPGCMTLRVLHICCYYHTTRYVLANSRKYKRQNQPQSKTQVSTSNKGETEGLSTRRYKTGAFSKRRRIISKQPFS